MSRLLWPGDERAGSTFTDEALVGAVVEVEAAWLAALAEHRVAPADEAGTAARRMREDLAFTAADVAEVAGAAEAAGNPVVPLVSRLRKRLDERHPEAARWLHRGLTSQDVLDSALMLMSRRLSRDLREELTRQVETLSLMADRHRATPMVGRTLTQPAVPITFGSKVTAWLHGVLDAAEGLDALVFPAQFGGAAGNRSGIISLGADPSAVAASAAAGLGLVERGTWHTNRAPVTRVGDALVGCATAWGRIANDVLTLGRPEIGELTEAAVEGRGGSSTMPHKVNPVLSVLIRRAALTAPAHGSLLHLAAADTGDERPAGAWHVEWEPLGLLARHTLTAARQASELLPGLEVHADRMAATLDAHRDEVSSEHRSLADLARAAGRPERSTNRIPADPPEGTGDALVRSAVDRARSWLAGGRE